ncbi:HU family DNA-binding protein [Reinekea sp. G2M2-21]|uniref:HU family DNA-binding protein n=1 Tax=Reinekea sp. G2M2-21 TaxID=2788942 RepID=UPI0018A8BE8F|nr:HU family DNA-binding protein [Reinekea sp. G2M2-21]
MNKTELIKAISNDTGHAISDVRDILNSFVGTLSNVLSPDESIGIQGFGTFKVEHIPERTSRNRRNGEVENYPAKNLVKFNAGKALRDAVNKRS